MKILRIIDVSNVGKLLYKWRKHSHIYWEINITTYGKSTFLSELGKFELEMGDIVIIPPDVSHSLSSNTGWQDYSFYVDKMDLNSNEICILKGKELEVFDISKRLFESFKKEKNGIDASFKEKSKFFLRHIMNIVSVEKNEPLSFKVREYININFFDYSLNEEVIAKYFEYNGNYIRRKFKEAYGLTPLQYLSEVRISQAKNLLRFSKNYSIGKIAFEIGFDDQLYFSRFFKKHTGLSPSEYRDKFSS